MEEKQEQEKRKGWGERLRAGLSKTSHKMTSALSSILTKRKLDQDLLDELEETLITADLGPLTSAKIIKDFSRNRFGKEISEEEVKNALAAQIEDILIPVAKPLDIDVEKKPFTLLMVGVNGAGKTTTIGKMAKHYKEQGKSVMLAACDTFRAAAVEQLAIWGQRNQCQVIMGEQGSDPAALAYRAFEKARQESVDLLMIDTAGRLQNKKDLMEELSKIKRVLQKQDPLAPHVTLLVLDATTGQNAFAQVDVFKEMTEISGLILTKLDGSAKGGVIVGIADTYKMPIHAVGVGESVDDLKSFDPHSYASMLMGL